ncbi:uncharacterized protein LOC135121615 [Zophobas morio]|uniref:uncharacterized protein LOC135121615 n=1 Tax=Zophobas morio TaxID=2755281 RepID=UPI00308283C2
MKFCSHHKIINILEEKLTSKDLSISVYCSELLAEALHTFELSILSKCIESIKNALHLSINHAKSECRRLGRQSFWILYTKLESEASSFFDQLPEHSGRRKEILKEKPAHILCTKFSSGEKTSVTSVRKGRLAWPRAGEPVGFADSRFKEIIFLEPLPQDSFSDGLKGNVKEEKKDNIRTNLFNNHEETPIDKSERPRGDPHLKDEINKEKKQKEDVTELGSPHICNDIHIDRILKSLEHGDFTINGRELLVATTEPLEHLDEVFFRLHCLNPYNCKLYFYYLSSTVTLGSTGWSPTLLPIQEWHLV